MRIAPTSKALGHRGAWKLGAIRIKLSSSRRPDRLPQRTRPRSPSATAEKRARTIPGAAAAFPALADADGILGVAGGCSLPFRQVPNNTEWPCRGIGKPPRRVAGRKAAGRSERFSNRPGKSGLICSPSSRLAIKAQVAIECSKFAVSRLEFLCRARIDSSSACE